MKIKFLNTVFWRMQVFLFEMKNLSCISVAHYVLCCPSLSFLHQGARQFPGDSVLSLIHVLTLKSICRWSECGMCPEQQVVWETVILMLSSWNQSYHEGKLARNVLSSHLHRPSPGDARCMYDTQMCFTKTIACSIQVKYVCTAVLLRRVPLSGWIPGFQPSSLSSATVGISHLCLFPSVPDTGPWEEATWVPPLKHQSTNRIEHCKWFCCLCIKG